MMPKRTMVAATAAAALALPAAATAAVPSSTVHRYQADYQAVAQKFGTRAPGRNIISHGLTGGLRASGADVLRSIRVLERMLHPAPVVHTRHTAARLDGDGDHDGDVSDSASAPARSRPRLEGDGDHDGDVSDSASAAASSGTSRAAAAPAHSAASSTAGSSGGYVIPSSVVQCESGGNPHAVSPFTGGGLYGILDSSWQSFGGTRYAPHPYNATPAQQGVIARAILASQGPGAWSCWK